MNKIVLVNNTAAIYGGALTVLKQLLEEVKKRKDKDITYYFFVTADLKNYESENIKIIDDIQGRKFLDRIKWDRYGMKKWCEENSIKPDLIISMQNIAVKFNNIPQIVYLHQPLPYAKESSWSLFKKDERSLWMYKNIYKRLIHNSLKEDTSIVVQTNWMKDALIENGVKNDNIVVSKPTISKINIDLINDLDKEEGKLLFFYPASDIKYKNHKVIADALIDIKRDNKELYNKIKVSFTLNDSASIYEYCKNNELLDCIQFLGSISYDKVLQYYKGCDAVLFPSYVETFGLPLIEAAQFGRNILVSDCNYSHEVLGDYANAKFIEYNNVDEWAKEISDVKPNIDNIKYESDDSSETWDEFFELVNIKVKRS